MAKDFLGNGIELGDVVIATQQGYRNFVKAEVVKITPKMLQLRAVQKINTKDDFKQFHDQVIVITNMENQK